MCKFQVLGYYFTSPTDKFSLKKLVEEAIDILQSCELEVVSIVCDQGPKNQGLFKETNVTTENPFFVHKTKKIYATYDPPHLLKSVRNNLKIHRIYYEERSIGNTPRTAFANWKHVEELYEMDSKDVLSHSVAAALNLYVAAQRMKSNAIDTARFLKKLDKLFDTVNSKTLKHQKKELFAVTKNSCHVEFWKVMISWIKTWSIRSSKGKTIVAPCKNGWILTLNAFIGISQDLLMKNKFILTNRFNQDVIENTFSSIRRRGSLMDNPDTYEFRHTIHKVIIANFLKQSVGKNCQDDEAYTLVNFSSFNKSEIFEIFNSEDCAEEVYKIMWSD
ncbi:hypothetical protein AVEN_141904-1 [Araneus ventricosus]|uniref:Transposable element P transposase n=1 Tax=Araneus ventricosus TaxID=182803 RepID=A0A4Y2KJZ1_ARAVE|nr:hypothetical protein AVEN_141904-1 [Araneus ventricosus]